MEELYDPSWFLEETLLLGDNASLEYPPPHFPYSSFAGFYSPPSCSDLPLFHPPNFGSDRCPPVAELGFPAADDFEYSLLLGVEGGGNAGPAVQSPEVLAFDPGRKSGTGAGARKKGHPSKNLMAERRRRKRLNDRLSMLRSIVPKISKMDRTSILGDTIDYVKELLGRIDGLEQGNGESTTNDVIELLKEVKPPNEALVRNSPKFHVERRNEDRVIEICCSGKPGLLLSTLSALDALGLEVEQCVISCFNDFAMRASCSEEIQVDSEDVIKQALFRSAGYGGKCM